MCTPTQGAMLPYGLKLPSTYFPFGPGGGLTQAHLSALDFQRSQINDYNIRVQLGLRNYQNSLGLSPFHAYITDPYAQAYFYKHDPRARFVQEEPKPSHSYIGLIGMAILNAKEKKLVLSDIYQWILDNYPYFRTRGPGWRNSIRHNLSLNDCFIKAGRSANGKGHYWAVHPANVEDFERGDFRRRRAQRKVRRHMGLSVPDDDDSPTPSPSQPWAQHDSGPDSDRGHSEPSVTPGSHGLRLGLPGKEADLPLLPHSSPMYAPAPPQTRKPSRKRLFDMASLLAPDDDDDVPDPGKRHARSENDDNNVHSAFIFQPIPENRVGENVKREFNSLRDPVAYDPTKSCPSQHVFSREGTREFDFQGKETFSDSENENRDADEEDDNEEIQVTSGEESPLTHLEDSRAEEKTFTAHEEDTKPHLSERHNVDTTGSSASSSSSHSIERRLISQGSPNKSVPENAMDLTSGFSPTVSPSSSSPTGVHYGLGPSKTRVKREDLRSYGQMTTNDDRTPRTSKTNGEASINKEISFASGQGTSKLLNEQSETYSQSGLENMAGDRSPEGPRDSGQRSPRRTPHEGNHSENPESVTSRGSELEATPGSSHNIRHDNLAQLQLLRNADMKLGFERGRPTELGPRLYNGETQPRSSAGDDPSKLAAMGMVSGMCPMSEALRRSSEGVTSWSNISKSPSPRDRLSAFSSLGLRQHTALYPPQFQHNIMRAFPVPPAGQRLLLPVSGQAGPRGSIPPSPMPRGPTSFDPPSCPQVVKDQKHE
ncbi:uncharacterized protein LOC101863747 [Aplysia californica]|uniref:Uncharacterized protein LOC101863747 n=1 Tax=Aplysia californica TaxID=6500 RepID=A0ABM0JQY0_APLCA|nr:uncharacterized protein LOC101863747 [Aplysia californica]